MARVSLLRGFKRRSITDETREISSGPISLDVSLARAHGYSEKQLDRMLDKISRIVRREAPITIRRFPDRHHTYNDGVVIFVGPCCYCHGKGTAKGKNYCQACEGSLAKKIKP